MSDIDTCPECQSDNVELIAAETPVPYGENGKNVVNVILPVWTCSKCSYQWVDYVADLITEKAIELDMLKKSS